MQVAANPEVTLYDPYNSFWKQGNRVIMWLNRWLIG